ncbi:MAG: glycosyltransferase family 4 protein [Acidimicrobiales bacterium]
MTAIARASAPRRRLVVVAHDIGMYGGMEKVHAELIRRLAGGWDISVVAARLDPDLRPLVTWHRIPIPSRPMPLKFLTFFVLAGLRLRRLGDGVVHTCGAIVPNRVDVASVHMCHAGVVAITGHLAPPEATSLRRLNTGVKRLLALAAERWCYRIGRVRLLHAVSVGVGSELAEHYPGVPVAVIPNGVDTRVFRPDEVARAAARAEHGVPESALVAVFAGGDWDRKGLGLAIDGVRSARSTDADVRLWVVGSGDERRYSARAGSGEWIRFFGHQADVKRFYLGADVLLLPSEYETYSLVAHEAAACGLPVVATAVHGVTDLVGKDEAGVIVQPRASDLAAALVRMADEPQRRRSLGEQARRRAMALDWETIAARFGEMLDSVSTGRG